jgi:hypothetical protein
MVRAAACCLNQDLQDFENFLALDIGLDSARSSMLFESGFSGFRGIFSVGHWFRWCAQQPVV